MRWQDVDTGLKRAEVLRGGRWGAPLELEVRHLAFDDTGISAPSAAGQPAGCDVPEQALVEQAMLRGGDELEVIESDADQRDGVDEAQAGGGHAGLRRGVGHDRADGVVRQQQTVEFLEHADGLLAAQRVLHQALVGVDLVDGELNLPALVVGADQLKRGGPPGRRAGS